MYKMCDEIDEEIRKENQLYDSVNNYFEKLKQARESGKLPDEKDLKRIEKSKVIGGLLLDVLIYTKGLVKEMIIKDRKIKDNS